jgi:hypothetical protein
VRSDAASEPASGSVRQNDPISAPLARHGRDFCFCAGVPSNDAGRPDAVVAADCRSERRRCLAELERNEHFFLHGQAQAAVFFGKAQAEEAEILHFLPQPVRNPVRLRDDFLVRHKPFTDEACNAVEQQVQGFLVSDHRDAPPELPPSNKNILML